MGYRSHEDDDLSVSKPVEDLPEKIDDVEAAEGFAEKYEGGGAGATPGGSTGGDSAEPENEATKGIEKGDDGWDPSETGEDGMAPNDDDGLDDDSD